MVTLIAIVATLLLATATGFIVFQWKELNSVDERVAELLAEVQDRDSCIQAHVVVLNLAMNQNAELKREADCHLVSLECVLEEVERLS